MMSAAAAAAAGGYFMLLLIVTCTRQFAAAFDDNVKLQNADNLQVGKLTSHNQLCSSMYSVFILHVTD